MLDTDVKKKKKKNSRGRMFLEWHSLVIKPKGSVTFSTFFCNFTECVSLVKISTMIYSIFSVLYVNNNDYIDFLVMFPIFQSKIFNTRKQPRRYCTLITVTSLQLCWTMPQFFIFSLQLQLRALFNFLHNQAT